MPPTVPLTLEDAQPVAVKGAEERCPTSRSRRCPQLLTAVSGPDAGLGWGERPFTFKEVKSFAIPSTGLFRVWKKDYHQKRAQDHRGLAGLQL